MEFQVKTVYLTPDLFLRLDTITRSITGRPILILTPEEMGGNLAAASCWAASICVNSEAEPEERRYRGVGVINLVNQINVMEFKNAQRPEMDWVPVPDHMIYDFLIWHEVGHLVMGHMGVIGLNVDRAPWNPMNTRARWLACLEMERRADRNAWKALFSNSPLPIRKKPEINLIELNKFAMKYKRFFDQPEKSYAPLTSAPGSMVLKKHLEEGVAWAEPVAKRLEKRAV